MQVVPLFGSGVFGKSAVVTRQRRLNCYYEQRPDADGGAPVVVYGTPGLVRKFTITSSLSGPVRAILGTTNALYAVVYDQFQSLSAAGAALFTQTIGSIIGLCSIAASSSAGSAANQVVMVDGVGGWVFSPNTGLFNALVAAWFVPGARTVTYLAGYFVTEIPGTSTYGVSNINDANSGSALSLGNASAYPDILKAVDNLAGNLILFCAQHMEFHQNVGAPAPASPFAAVLSATNEWGLAAVFSRGHVDDSIIFLGETRQGVRRVCQLKGYAVAPISDEIDAVINTYGFTYSDAVALTYQVDKHPFYQLTFPTMGRSFLYDCSTGIWNETQTGLSTGAPVRHVGNLSSYYAGEQLVTDWQNGNVYRADTGVYTDNGSPILREVVTRHATKGGNRFRIPVVYLRMETGVGLPSGQGSNPQISIECSKDGGRTWLAARLVGLGMLGNYMARVVARRWGQARSFTFRIRMSDPVKFVITTGSIEVRGKQSTK